MSIPILSICIPTYNRASYLKDTLNSVVLQKRFQDTNDVEIVVSDNCSDDNTRDVVAQYIASYGSKVKYFRNDKNVKDLNFELALSRGEGDFLRLNNDTLVHLDGSLDKMLEVIESNVNSNVIFFSNRALKLKSPVIFYNLNEFIGTASYVSTWIGGLGIWRKEFEQVDNFSEKVKLQLVQTDVLCKIITSKSFVQGCIYDKRLCISVVPAQKGGYNFVRVFVDNYFTILEEYVKVGHISNDVFKKEKFRILFSYILPRLRKMVTRGKRLNFDTKGLSQYIHKHYSKELYFPFVALIVLFYKMIFRLKGSSKLL